ncbi:hypothetical protein [Endozoicomonas sp. ONNA2]|uniref:hypothetical protein n=1 Tax=Endozoicomonas sp. ONNA2 TaxID=2828741 RepID=UPI002147AF34|nr:hypothetical protein [Endozoicomonas sp. ONNA2]
MVTTVSPTRSLRPPVIHSGRAAHNSDYSRPPVRTAQHSSSLASDYGSRATSVNYGSRATSATGSSTATGITDNKQKLKDVLKECDARVVGVYDRGNVVGEIGCETFLGKILKSTSFKNDMSTKQVALRSGNDSRSDIILMTRYDGGESPSSITNGPLSTQFLTDLHTALLRKRLDLNKLVHLINANDVVGQ